MINDVGEFLLILICVYLCKMSPIDGLLELSMCKSCAKILFWTKLLKLWDFLWRREEAPCLNSPDLSYLKKCFDDFYWLLHQYSSSLRPVILGCCPWFLGQLCCFLKQVPKIDWLCCASHNNVIKPASSERKITIWKLSCCFLYFSSLHYPNLTFGIRSISNISQRYFAFCLVLISLHVVIPGNSIIWCQGWWLARPGDAWCYAGKRAAFVSKCSCSLVNSTFCFFFFINLCDLGRFSSYACYRSLDVLEDLSLTKAGRAL